MVESGTPGSRGSYWILGGVLVLAVAAVLAWWLLWAGDDEEAVADASSSTTVAETTSTSTSTSSTTTSTSTSTTTSTTTTTTAPDPGLPDGTYRTLFTVGSDLGGHEGSVGMPTYAIDLVVTFASITIEGPEPFVGVSGDVAPDGSFVATGSGTVAGLSDIAVVLEGTVSADALTGEYLMGAQGGLPGGEPIIYEVTGDIVVPPSEDVVAFFDAFNQAQVDEDAETLFDLLHPAVIGLYGEEACRAYLETAVNPDVAVLPVEELDFGDWEWERDDVSTVIPDAYSLLVSIIVGDADPVEQETHIAVRPDETLGWFTDCGDPLG